MPARVDPDYKPSNISQEVLTGLGDGNPMWDPFLMAKRLKMSFPQANIIVILREQLDYIKSLYAFRVILRGLEWRTLDSFLVKRCQWLLNKLSYDRLISRYIALFGREQLLVLPYEMLRADHEAFIGQLLQYMGIEERPQIDATWVNRGSRNSLLIDVHRLLNFPFSVAMEQFHGTRLMNNRRYRNWANAFFYAKRKTVAPLLNRLLAQSSGSLEISTEWRARLVPVFQESNRRLVSLVDFDLKQYGYVD